MGTSWSRVFRKRSEECLTYLRHWVCRKHVPTKKFLILTHWRSGSELLIDLLNNHPYLHCDSEIFLEFVRLPRPTVLFPHWYMNGKSSGIKKKIYGFKLMSEQLSQILSRRWHGGANEFLNFLHTSGWKIIHLKRNNIFQKAVSSLVAQSTNKWHIKEGDRLGEKITIDTDQLLTRMKSYEECMADEESYLKGIPHLNIVYEEGLLEMSSHQTTMDAVYSYIGVPSVSAKTQLKRTIGDRLSDTIENYDEVYDVVRQSPYARFLHSKVEVNVPGSPVS